MSHLHYYYKSLLAPRPRGTIRDRTLILHNSTQQERSACLILKQFLCSNKVQE